MAKSDICEYFTAGFARGLPECPPPANPFARLSSVLDFTFAALELNHPMIISRSNFLPGTVISTIVATAIISFLVACGDPKYQAPAIAVTFLTQPPASINTGSTIGITAVVANDPKNAGVNFGCVPAGDCGLFNPARIASNVPTCYEAPGQVPSGNTVTIIATSVSDPTKSVTSSPITIVSGAQVQVCAP